MTLDPSHIDGDATASQGTATRAVPADWWERLSPESSTARSSCVLYYILFVVFWAVSGRGPDGGEFGGGGAQ